MQDRITRKLYELAIELDSPAVQAAAASIRGGAPVIPVLMQLAECQARHNKRLMDLHIQAVSNNVITLKVI